MNEYRVIANTRMGSAPMVSSVTENKNDALWLYGMWLRDPNLTNVALQSRSVSNWRQE